MSRGEPEEFPGHAPLPLLLRLAEHRLGESPEADAGAIEAEAAGSNGD
jgi:hypothetical protein